LRDFPQATKRGNYKVPERLRTKQEIYRLILEGCTYQRIMDQLQISERTFYRYLDVIFAEDKDFLDNNVGVEELRTQIRLCKDRMLEDRFQLEQWMKDPDFKDKVTAMNLAAELSAAVLKIYTEGPIHLSQRHAFVRNALTTEQQGSRTNGLRLNLSLPSSSLRPPSPPPSSLSSHNLQLYNEVMQKIEDEKKEKQKEEEEEEEWKEEEE
jgi:hypothetical protein